MFKLKYIAAGVTALALTASAAMAEKVLRIQSVLPSTADEVFMLNEFGKDVADLTGGLTDDRSVAGGCRRWPT